MSFEEALRERILVMDGSMQEMLYLHGCDTGPEAVFDYPANISLIYSEFLEAGCDILSTYTFSADGNTLRSVRSTRSPFDIALKATELARKSAGTQDRKVWIAGEIGQAEGLSKFHKSTIKAIYKPLIRGLQEGGADFLYIRAFSRPSMAREILRTASDCGCTLPVAITISPKTDPLMPQIKAFWNMVKDYKPAAFGIEGFPSRGATQIMREIASWCPLPLICCRDVETAASVLSHRERSDRLPRKMNVMSQEGLINIAGGGRGTMPGHICGLCTVLEGTKPRKIGDSPLNLVTLKN